MSEPDENPAEPDDEESRRQHELDGLRIRQVARARQAAMRAASYCVIGSLACAVAGLDLIWRAARQFFTARRLLWPAINLLIAAGFIFAVPWLWRRAMALRNESRRKALPEPKTAPDFSTLNDGSQIVENLKKIN